MGKNEERKGKCVMGGCTSEGKKSDKQGESRGASDGSKTRDVCTTPSEGKVMPSSGKL